MTEILDIAQQHLRRVKTTGNTDIMAVCPFHRKADGTEERHPSFAMNVYNGLWYCHSCHARGNLYTFLRDIGFSRADIQFHYGGVLDAAARHAPKKDNPLDPIEPVALEPLPESFLGLFDFCPQLLLDEGYPKELLQQLDVGFDQKHLRVTFPLRNMRGQLVGISGRTVVDAPQRYKVYDWEYRDFGLPERKTEKRMLLWNIHNVLAQNVFETDPGMRYVVVVEGFKAALRIMQAGILNVVALLGSYMSGEQQRLLERLGGPVLLMLDNNDAGQSGQLDAARRLVRSRDVYVVEYDAPQPSDLRAEDIPAAILGAEPFVTWLQRTSAENHP